MINSSNLEISITLLKKQFSALCDLQCLTVHCDDLHRGIHSDLDYLSIWQLWRRIKPSNTSRLHLIITTQQPLSREELAQILKESNYCSQIINQLLAQYPPAISGVHRLIFRDERLSIDLWFGDVVEESNPNNSKASIRITPTTEIPQTFAIIGAGIAGLSMAEALTRRGFPVTLIEQDQPLSGASGNPCALLLSKLPKLNRVSRNLQTMGALTTVRWWQDWANNVVTSSGALLKIDTDDLEKIQGYPSDLVRVVHAQEASRRSGLICHSSYLLMSQAATINPHAIRQHVLASPLITIIKARAAQLIRNKNDSAWIILDKYQKTINQSTHVIIANAKDCVALCPSLPPLTVIRGQISWLAIPPNAPQCSIGYGGYTTTFQDKLLLGSSFIRDDLSTSLRLNEHETNLNLLKAELPQLAENLTPMTTWQGRASLRSLPRDSMPVVGQVPHMDNVFVLAGLGSKGFSFAPLCAELLASQILGEALPMIDQLVSAIRPDRFIKKERIRKPYYTPSKNLESPL
jgi:tRNA 5-methylaminomethyl-2-thiouridine biosynthesis bifunctional protein